MPEHRKPGLFDVTPSMVDVDLPEERRSDALGLLGPASILSDHALWRVVRDGDASSAYFPVGGATGLRYSRRSVDGNGLSVQRGFFWRQGPGFQREFIWDTLMRLRRSSAACE